MNLNKPKPFTPNKNQLAQDWQVWKEEFLVYLKLSNAYTQFSEEQRALLLLNNMGTEAIKAIEQISFDSPDDKKDLDILLLKFDEFFNPSLNEVEERCKFFSRRKHPDEDLDKYVLDIKEKATKCNFGNQSEKFIIDMLVLSMDKNLRDLILASKLDMLSDVVYSYKQYNINQEKMKGISESIRQNLNTKGLENAKICNNEPTGKQPQARRVCSKCGTNHAYRECPAFDTICQICSGKGHYTSKCTVFDLGNMPTNLSQGKNEESKAPTNMAKQSQEYGQKVDTLQQCLWCNFSHMPGKCFHDARCTGCYKFPHNICFHCKNNPHEQDCYYKYVVPLPIIHPSQDTVQAADHGPNEYLRRNNQFRYHAEPTVVQDAYIVDDFEDVVEITTYFQGQPQRRNRRTRQANPNQHQQNRKRRTSNKNKNEEKNSDSCCIC